MRSLIAFIVTILLKNCQWSVHDGTKTWWVKIYSSNGRVLHLLRKLEPDIQDRLPMLHRHFATGLAHSDAPEHKRFRGILAQAFTPKISENMRPITHEVVARTLNELSGDVDLISDLFTPIPALVVGRLLGSSESDIPHLIRWAGAINGLYEKGGNIDPQKAVFVEEMLHHEPSLIPAAIDEMAKFDGSVPRSWRITKRHSKALSFRTGSPRLLRRTSCSHRRSRDHKRNTSKISQDCDKRSEG